MIKAAIVFAIPPYIFIRFIEKYTPKNHMWSPIGQTCGQPEKNGIYVVRFER